MLTFYGGGNRSCRPYIGDTFLSIETILVEGWRFIPHSYSIINEWQCLELIKHKGIKLFMHDSPLYLRRWKPRRGLFDAASEAAIAALGELPAGEQPDATLRLTIPVRMKPAPHGGTFVLATADWGWLPRTLMEGRVCLKTAHAGSDVVIVTPSAWSRWGLIRAGADPSRVEVVPHGVDTTVFRPALPEVRNQLRRKRGWEGKFVFLNVSAMTLNKGTPLLMKAFARIAGRNRHVRLKLKGIDSLYRSSESVKWCWSRALTAEERRACQTKLEYFGGILPFQQLAQLYQAADAYVSPYRSESFNLPVLEAVACGLPVICTKGGPTDDFTRPEFARHVSARIIQNVKKEGKGISGRREMEPEELELQPDLEHLTELMTEVLDNHDLYQQARRVGPALAGQQFTWRHAVDRLLDVMAW